MKKVVFYILIIAINLMAFGLMGLSFLTASNANGEGGHFMTEMETFLRKSFFITIINLIFAALILLVSFLFRKSVNLNKSTLKKIFFIEFGSFMFTYLVVYLYIYLKFSF